MEGRTDIVKVRQQYGINFIGSEEIAKIAPDLGVQLPAVIPELLYTKDEIDAHAADSILILGTDKMEDGRALTLMSLRERFGIDSNVNEPCFYNQDWYLKENFMQTGIENKWYLIRKNVFEDSRAVSPTILEK